MANTNLFCINEKCGYFGKKNQGNIVKAGFYKASNKELQMYRCKFCNKHFSETRESGFFRSHYSPKTIKQIIYYTSKGYSIRKIAEMLNLSKDGVHKTIIKASSNCRDLINELMELLNLELDEYEILIEFMQKRRLLGGKP